MAVLKLRCPAHLFSLSFHWSTACAFAILMLGKGLTCDPGSRLCPFPRFLLRIHREGGRLHFWRDWRPHSRASLSAPPYWQRREIRASRFSAFQPSDLSKQEVEMWHNPTLKKIKVILRYLTAYFHRFLRKTNTSRRGVTCQSPTPVSAL